MSLCLHINTTLIKWWPQLSPTILMVMVWEIKHQTICAAFPTTWGFKEPLWHLLGSIT